jgi:putative transposase
MAVMAGIDFFTVEVLTWRGLMTYYVLFFTHLETRGVWLAGITRHPDQSRWSRWPATRATRAGNFWVSAASRCTIGIRSSAHDSGRHWRRARSPNLNAHAERWVRLVKEECLSKLILFGEGSLRCALTEFIDRFHSERTTRARAMSFCSESSDRSERARTSRAMQRTSGWPTKGLCLCRMNYLAIRAR